jgi:hypothetical protein
MAQFIFLRLVPQKPVAADVFGRYLSDFDPAHPTAPYHVLVLDAYDRSFANPNGEPTRLGRAVYLPDVMSVGSVPDPHQLIPVPTTDWPHGTSNIVPGTMIVQHRTAPPILAPPGNFRWDMKSVATAAIPVTFPYAPEYDQPDLIIRVNWAAVTGSTIDYDGARLLVPRLTMMVPVCSRPSPLTTM